MTHQEPKPESPDCDQASKQKHSGSEHAISPSSNSVRRMFDSIAPYYVLLNHILSFGMDFSWRRKLANAINKDKKLQVLDLATGTGDLLISLLKINQNITNAVGLDISENMLKLCRKELVKQKLYDRATLILADAADTGLFDESFDVVTMGFGIRNTHDVSKTLREIRRLLKQDGTVLILEFSLPSNRIIRRLYLLYLRNFVPLFGRLLSRDKNAYRYLNTSIENFYSAEDLSSLMSKAGFSDISAMPLTFGITCIYRGSKTSSSLSGN